MSARHRKCPTPAKVKYATAGEALFVSRKMPNGRTEARVYRCKDHYHLTSKPKWKR